MAKPKNESFNVMNGISLDSTTALSSKRNVNPNSLKNLHPRTSGTGTKKAYMQLNLGEYEDYIYRMSRVSKKTMTGYVMELIKQDRENNMKAYEGLRLLPQLEKPPRVAKNVKKTNM